MLDYAERTGLQWLDDPSNVDRRFDRNFLRHDILPRLRTRWPDISTRLMRSAGHAGEAAELLEDLADIDLSRLDGRAERLPIDRLTALSGARQRNLLRYSLKKLGLSTPTAMQLSRVLEDVIPARPDARPLVSWPGASVRRYRNGLYLLPEKLVESPAPIKVLSCDTPLGPGLGTLKFVHGAPRGLAEHFWQADVQVRFRRGGEKFQPEGQSHRRKLKKLLQEELLLSLL